VSATKKDPRRMGQEQAGVGEGWGTSWEAMLLMGGIVLTSLSSSREGMPKLDRSSASSTWS
jgi:hypothetical protein